MHVDDRPIATGNVREGAIIGKGGCIDIWAQSPGFTLQGGERATTAELFTALPSGVTMGGALFIQQEGRRRRKNNHIERR